MNCQKLINVKNVTTLTNDSIESQLRANVQGASFIVQLFEPPLEGINPHNHLNTHLNQLRNIVSNFNA